MNERFTPAVAQTADGDFVIRTMSRAELDLALDWAAAEGWNPGLSDAEAFHAADPEGFLVGLLRDGRLAGYGVLRACRSGCKIGPLFADRPDDADALFGALRARAADGEAVCLDVPEPNAAALALAARAGLRAVFETARMYTGATPDLALARTYGVTSFELG